MTRKKEQCTSLSIIVTNRISLEISVIVEALSCYTLSKIIIITNLNARYDLKR